MKLNLQWFLLVLCFTFGSQAKENETLTGLLEDIWQYQLSINPVNATSLGIHNYDHLLADFSPNALKHQNKTLKMFLAKLHKINKNSLSRNEQITYLMQERALQNQIDNYEFKSHYVPLTSEYGFHSAMAQLPNVSRFKTVTDYENYLKRLTLIPQVFRQHIEWMKLGLDAGIAQPKVVMKGFERSVKPYFDTATTDSVYFEPFANMHSTIKTGDALKLSKQARLVIDQKVFPAYKDFYDFLVDHYIPNASDDIAVISWPEGKRFYQNRSDYYTTTSLSTEEIHQLGLSEVARIRTEMQSIVDTVKFDGDINAFIQHLRTDPKFYANSPQELIEYASYIAKKMDAQLPKLFKKLPRTPYGVAPVPDSIAPKYTTGRYISPTRDDQPGYYWVNTYALDKRPLYAIPALTLHEAVPGHHLQISLAREMDKLPPVRRYTYISAFGEGWGLYSEYLGKEVGIYEDPYDDFGRLSYEMWRACRLVVDTGMHTKGWSRQRAIDFMLKNTALSEHNVVTEIDRYISWPGQALSYKIGELTIKKLRAKAENKLAEKFDVRDFHQALLEHGSVPLLVLEENIDSFIIDNL